MNRADEPPSFDLPYSPPLAWDELLGFLARRAVPGVERVEGRTYRRTLAIDRRRGVVTVEAHAGKPGAVLVKMTGRLADRSGEVLARVHRLLDFDADPVAIDRDLARDPLLRPLVRARPGLRVPGTVDPFELVVRAVVGQQITVAAATTIMGRITRAFGERPETGEDGLDRLAVTAHRLADVDPDEIAALGMPRARAACLVTLAREFADGRITLNQEHDEEDLERLRRIAGIGEWTVQYIAMRALGRTDAFPHTDIALRRALDSASPAGVLAASERWRPWRAYAVLHLWHRNVPPRSDRGSLT